MEESISSPDPELQRQYRELVVSDNYSFLSVKDLARYLRRQPPQSEDAVMVGDLLIRIREDVGERIDSSIMDTSNYDWEDYNCRCRIHMTGIVEWYKLAILLDPNNPVPYERLAREIWWAENEWPGSTLEPLSREYDKTTLRIVMDRYQKEDSRFAEQVHAAMRSL